MLSAELSGSPCSAGHTMKLIQNHPVDLESVLQTCSGFSSDHKPVTHTFPPIS